jgi:hypothetical protein
MDEFKVGQVWTFGRIFVMVSELVGPKKIRVGEAEKRGTYYAMISSPERIKKTNLAGETLVFDTEAEKAGDLNG